MVSLQYIEEILDTVKSSITYLSIPVPQYLTLVVPTLPYLCHPYQYEYIMRVIELMIPRVTCPHISHGTTPTQ